MARQMLHLTQENINYFDYIAQKNADCSAKYNIRRKRLKRITMLMIDTELTEKQRYCILQHLLYGRKQKDIAKDMDLSESTVCRHIAAGKKKLQRATGYSM